MSQLVLMRHGESTWNAEGRFAGRVNVPLTDKGRQQAKEGGQKISEIPFDCCLTSTLIRAQETVLIVLQQSKNNKTPVFLTLETYQPMEHEIPVYADSNLDEVYCGDWEGGHKTVVSPDRKWPYEIVDEYFPGGESFTSVTNRSVQVYTSHILPKLQHNQNVLVIGHGIALQALIGYLENLSWDELKWVRIDNASPRIYEWNGSLKLS